MGGLVVLKGWLDSLLARNETLVEALLLSWPLLLLSCLLWELSLRVSLFEILKILTISFLLSS